MDKSEEFNPAAKFASMYWTTYFGTMGLAWLYLLYEYDKGRKKS
jgi:hypothetical protein